MNKIIKKTIWWGIQFVRMYCWSLLAFVFAGFVVFLPFIGEWTRYGVGVVLFLLHCVAVFCALIWASSES